MKKNKIKYGEYYNNSNIDQIDLSNIETIEESAFASSSIREIIGVARNVGNFAFSVCENLEGKIIVGGKRVGRASFERSPLIEEVVLEDDVREIDGWAFDECRGLKKVTFPNKLESIKEEAFHDIGIQTLTIGKIDTIAANAFSECSELETVNIQKINKSIQSNAFSKCSKLKNITYDGKTIMSLGENEKFKGISIVDDKFCITYDETVQNDNGEITIETKNLPIESDIPLVYGREDLSDRTLNLEGDVKSSEKTIPDGILRRNKNIRSLNLDNVEKIGKNAFDKCTNLASVSLSHNLREMGSCAFQDSGIESIDLSKTRN